MSEKKAKAARKSGLTPPKRATGPFPRVDPKIGPDLGLMPKDYHGQRGIGKAYTGQAVIKLRSHWQGRGSRKGTPPFTKRNKYKKLHGISEYSDTGVPTSFKRRRYC